MMFCPLLYYQASLSTWNVPDVFQKLDGSKESHLQDALRSVPTWIKKRYAWGVDEKASLPYGYVPSQKEEAVSVRPYDRCVSRIYSGQAALLVPHWC